MKRILSFISIIILSCNSLFAQDHLQQTIAEANKAYDDGLYNQSIELYQAVIDSGYTSTELYYNLGNAYFKLKDIPSAILYYEKAKKTAPKNEDILFNLNIAKTRIVDRIDEVPELFYIKWWKSFVNLFSLNTWTILSLISFSIIFVCATVFFISRNTNLRKFSFWFGILIIFFSFISFTISYQKYFEYREQHEAIIFTPTITVKSSPNQNSIDLFVIHEGTKIEIIDKVEGWYEIRIANGSVGWLPAHAIKMI